MNVITQFSLFGVQYLLPLYLQQAHGLGPLQTGLHPLPHRHLPASWHST